MVVIRCGIVDGCMGRPPRADEANAIDHMLNRGSRRVPLFHKSEDFEAFLADIGRGHRTLANQTLRVLSAAESLAHGGQSGGRRGNGAMRPVVGSDAHPTPSRS